MKYCLTWSRCGALLLAFLTVPPGGGADDSRAPGPDALKERVAEVRKRVAADYPRLEALYKHLHANPEFREALGAGQVHERPMSMGGEDFSRYVREGVPGFYYFVGTAAPEQVAEARREGGRPLPSVHSNRYYPMPEPIVKTGVLTMTLAVLHLLGK